jgi:uncharacterized protein Usg
VSLVWQPRDYRLTTGGVLYYLPDDPQRAAVICLAGPRHRTAPSGAAQIPGFLAWEIEGTLHSIRVAFAGRIKPAAFGQENATFRLHRAVLSLGIMLIASAARVGARHAATNGDDCVISIPANADPQREAGEQRKPPGGWVSWPRSLLPPALRSPQCPSVMARRTRSDRAAHRRAG